MKYHSPSMWTSLSCRLPEPLCSSCAFIAGLTETLRIDNGPMEARYVLRVVGAMGSCTAQSPDIRTRGGDETTCACHRHSGTWRIPESPPAAGSECATSTRSGACPIRRRGRPSSHPRGHERAGRTRAESPQRTASRAGAWQGSGSGRHASGRYQAAAPSLVLEPWRHRRNIPKCLFVPRSIACAGCLVRFGWQL